MKVSFRSLLTVKAKSSVQQRECTVCRGDLLKRERLNRCGRCGAILHDECGESCPVFACDGTLSVINEPKKRCLCIYCLRSIKKNQKIYRCGDCGTLYHAGCGDDCPNQGCVGKNPRDFLAQPRRFSKALQNVVGFNKLVIAGLLLALGGSLCVYAVQQAYSGFSGNPNLLTAKVVIQVPTLFIGVMLLVLSGQVIAETTRELET